MGRRFFSHVSEADWNDWQWQYKNRIDTAEKLAEYLPLSEEDIKDINLCLETYRMAITPYYLSLIDPDDPDDPIRKQAVPDSKELYIAPEDQRDPLHEESDSPCTGLTHRYPDRVLFLVTNQCSMYCRHCTRRRFSGQVDTALTKQEIDASIEYIRNNSVVRDVLVSGGDPLTLPDETIEYILKELRSIEHVEIIRIGTRVPVVMPQRITPELCAMLKKYHPLWINVHFNHPNELTEEAKKACSMLLEAGIPLGNQSVLLSGVNDCIHTMRKLVRGLVQARIRPYYIYQCDLSLGLSHFRTSVSKGMEIIEALQGHTTGFAVPTFVIDAPGGGGKIPIMPNHIVSQGHRRYVLRNFEGTITTYVEPEGYEPECTCDVCTGKTTDDMKGVVLLSEGKLQNL
ncbi:MAG: lysine 2,3-aminomutase [Clostridia bacterium]|nr:lysine 2,3-aminomutase [Clostridia bacterium]